MDIEATIREKFRSLSRVWTSIDDASGPPRKPVRGYGDIAVVARAIGISRRAILVGLRESTSGHMLPEGRVRRPGGGRKSGVAHYPDLPETLEGLVEPLTRGDPESPLRWTCKSARRLSRELATLGYAASSRLVGALLHGMGYSLQGHRKTVEDKQHKELIGNYANRDSHGDELAR